LLKLWEVATGKELLSFGTGAYLRGLAITPDGLRVAASADREDAAIRIWDPIAGKEVLTLRGHTDLVRRVCWSRDGRRVVSTSDDLTVKIWDAVSRQE